MTDLRKRKLEEEAARLNNKYGPKAGALGSAKFDRTVIPTGSLALDYALGRGGWERGHIIHVFGEPDIGKSSTLGLAAVRSAQAQGLFTGIIAVEPGFDEAWAIKNGVDPDLLVIARPNDGEEAFEILYDWVTGDLIDFMLFDSIGGVVNPSEIAEEGSGKARVGGASGIVTNGIRKILMPTWKNDKSVMLLNQIRDDLKSRFGGVKPPGGHLLQHAADVWVHLRQSSGKDTFKRVRVDGEEVIVGRNLTANITRNKLCEGTGVKAKFWYYNMDSEHGPVGIDAEADIIATAQRAGVIKRHGAYYRHDGFPGEKHQVQSKEAMTKLLADTPGLVARIRDDVMTVMASRAKVNDPMAPDLNEYDEAAEAA